MLESDLVLSVGCVFREMKEKKAQIAEVDAEIAKVDSNDVRG